MKAKCSKQYLFIAGLLLILISGINSTYARECGYVSIEKIEKEDTPFIVISGGGKMLRIFTHSTNFDENLQVCRHNADQPKPTGKSKRFEVSQATSVRFSNLYSESENDVAEMNKQGEELGYYCYDNKWHKCQTKACADDLGQKNLLCGLPGKREHVIKITF